MVSYFYHELGKMRNDTPVNIKWRSGASLKIIARPRYGKGGVTKPLVVKLSKTRHILFFDYKSEWVRHITKYNVHSNAPDKIIDVRIIQDFTFKLSQFNRPSDFIALGFDYDQCMYLTSMINDGYSHYEDDVLKFREMLREIPVREKGGAVAAFNRKFGTTLDSPMNYNSKVSLINHFRFIDKWFWQGESDQRPIHDFAKLWAGSRNMIINLKPKGESTNEMRARAFCGKILQQIRSTHIYKHPVIGFEEARHLIPNGIYKVPPSSISEIYDLVTDYPKYGVNVILIAQSETQLHPLILSSMFGQAIIGKLDFVEGGAFKEISERLDASIREFCLIDDNSKQWYFTPGLPCCEYESDL